MNPPPADLPTGRPDDELMVAEAFRRLDGHLEGPPLGWQRRVLERVAEGPRRSHQHWRFAIVMAPVLVVLVLVLRRAPHEGPSTSLALAVDVLEDGPGAGRGRGAQVGDHLRLRTRAGLPGEAELRLYVDDVLAFTCRADCLRNREGASEGIAAVVLVKGRGRHRALAIVGPHDDRAVGQFDADVAALTRAGVAHEIAPPIDVH